MQVIKIHFDTSILQKKNPCCKSLFFVLWERVFKSLTVSLRCWHGCVPYKLRSLQLHIGETCLYFLWWGKAVKLHRSAEHFCGCYWPRCKVCVCVFVALQNTKHYELLNYSEHGTTVDNVLYSCDFSEKTSPCPPSGLVAKVQGIIRKYISFICLDWLEGTQVCVPS